ncbi:MAG: radical SAM protein, partial [Bacteroidota bacterium]|nr:radical SAM protein [Bacteroidota bacterium]
SFLHEIMGEIRYEDTVEPVIRFLRGQEPTLAQRICSRQYLPEGKRFERLNDLDLDFGEMGIYDKAVYLATLYIEDLADFIRENVDPHFELIKYAEKLCLYLPEFDPLIKELENESLNSIDELMLSILEEDLSKVNPQMVGFCVPFPGNLYGALKCGALLKKKYPSILTVMGGGYVNTELRQLSDVRLFDYLDFLVFDDGELPLQRLITGFQKAGCSIEQLKSAALNNNEHDGESLVRTVFFHQDAIHKVQFNSNQNIAMAERGVPDYAGLPLSLYLDSTDELNPMMRLWSNGRWNKMMLAHGCYWAKCAFCDTSLDYIARYETVSASILADRMEAIIKQTGQSGFHFVDEAAPPAVLRQLALEILKRHLQVTWWGNIRFEKAFTPDLCKLLAQSGCIAVSGGLEVASDRLLTLMNKGVTLAGAANACKAFSEAGIMVHAYLMYGFPSQTAQETIDSLEVVRQFFKLGLVRSAFWHRFALTVHSPVSACPEKYGVKKINTVPNPFSNNESAFEDLVHTDHDLFGEGLRLATYNYMHGAGFDKKVFAWFIHRVPKTGYPPSMVESFLNTRTDQ